jgi:hypothetical protein
MKKNKMLVTSSLAVIALLAVIEPAMAITFGDMGNNVGDSAGGLFSGGKKIGLMLGLFFAVGGIIGFATHKKTNVPISIPIIAFVAGILLSSITVFVDTGSETLFGAGTTNEWSEIGN